MKLVKNNECGFCGQEQVTAEHTLCDCAHFQNKRLKIFGSPNFQAGTDLQGRNTFENTMRFKTLNDKYRQISLFGPLPLGKFS